MIQPASIDALAQLSAIAPLQAAIVAVLKEQLLGVNVKSHPGKVDISELIEKTSITAPGVLVGWSKIKRVAYTSGGYTLQVEWVAYIAAEAKLIDSRRVEKEVIALAIGTRILEILDDFDLCLWGLTGVLPPEESPQPELKPIFTVSDSGKGTAYYAVTWSQGAADLGTARFASETATTDPENGVLLYDDEATIDHIKHWIPAEEVDDA